MVITCESIGKKYRKDWILKDFNTSFNPNDYYVVNGANGSGKSTILKLISGFLTPTVGVIQYYQNEQPILPSKIYKQIAYCAPYIDVFEDYTIPELHQFYCRLKPLKNKLTASEFLDALELNNIKGKVIKNFSSGMRQRVKLALAILADTPVLLLDEPTSNLDKTAIKWYQNLVDTNKENRIILVASNLQEEEYFFCNKKIELSR